MIGPRFLLAAFFGTLAFSIVYNIPKKYFWTCGLIGVWGWLLYGSARLLGATMPTGIFVGTIGVALVSRFAAVWRKCPEIIFLISGLFPLIPGADIYWTAYYIVANNSQMTAESGKAAIGATLAIVLGMVLVHELPQRVFTLGMKKKR